MKKKRKVLFALCALFVAMFSMSIMTYAVDIKKPGTVTGLKQVNASDTSVKIEWNADLVPNCYYDVYLSTTGAEGSFVQQNTYKNSSVDWTFYHLAAGRTYYVKVIAFTYSYPDSLYADSESDVLKIVTSPKEVTGVKQTNATTNSVTLQWNKADGATGYRIYNKEDGTMKLLVTTSKNKAMIKNLKSSKKYNLYVMAYRKAGSYVAEQNYYKSDGYISDYELKFQPGKMNVSKVKADDYYMSTKKVYVNWTELDHADGYQMQVYSYNGKSAVSSQTTTSHYLYLEDIDGSKFYKVRIRAYAEINGTKKFGAWSNFKYIGQQVEVVTLRQAASSKRQIKVAWEKMNGANNYTVYMSTNRTSGYKSVGSTKGTSFNISKFGKSNLSKNKTYYVYVVANKKVSKYSTYKSGATYCWSLKLTK